MSVTIDNESYYKRHKESAYIRYTKAHSGLWSTSWSKSVKRNSIKIFDYGPKNFWSGLGWGLGGSIGNFLSGGLCNTGLSMGFAGGFSKFCMTGFSMGLGAGIGGGIANGICSLFNRKKKCNCNC